VPLTSIQLFLTALEQPGTLGTVGLVDAAEVSPLFPIVPDEQPTQNLLVVEDLIRATTSDIATYRNFYVNGGLPPAVFERNLVAALDETTVVLPAGVSTVNVEMESRSLGRSPLRIQIMTPDRVLLAETSFGVRSTAVPGLGLLLSATALLFLMVWWARSIMTTRARRKHPASANPEPIAEAQLGS